MTLDEMPIGSPRLICSLVLLQVQHYKPDGLRCCHANDILYDT